MKGLSDQERVQRRLARSVRRLALMQAREIERDTRARRRRKHGPRPAKLLAQLRAVKQQLDGV